MRVRNVVVPVPFVVAAVAELTAQATSLAVNYHVGSLLGDLIVS